MSQYPRFIWIKKILSGTARADLFSFLLLYLMLLLIIGTVFQKHIGVYQAQKIFFSSYWIPVGSIFFLPGTKTVLFVLFFSLVIRLFLEEWVWKKAGNILLHLGVVLFLVGGFMTSIFTREGAMVIREGERVHYISDYYRYELAVLDSSHSAYDEITRFQQKLFKKGNRLVSDSLPFTITVKEFAKNMSLIKRQSVWKENAYGVARIYQLKKESSERIAERNRAGILLDIKYAGQNQNISYLVFQDMPVPQYVYVQGKRYQLILRHKRSYLPVSVKLLDFYYTRYPGTVTAKTYQSDIALEKDGHLLWKGRIEMNKPLHYKGYTFYQSSFEENEEEQKTILAVVHNTARLFPYVSALVMLTGLFIHLIQRLPKVMSSKRMKKRHRA